MRNFFALISFFSPLRSADYGNSFTRKKTLVQTFTREFLGFVSRVLPKKNKPRKRVCFRHMHGVKVGKFFGRYGSFRTLVHQGS